MNKYRSAALTLAACAASLAVVACSAGTPTASSASTSTGAPSQSGSASAASSSAATIPGRAVAIKGKLGSFPVPAGAKVVENLPGNQAFVLVFGLVTPADVSRFYATALPQAGFTITTNAMLHKGGDTGAFIVFTGHGLKGNINSLVQFPGMSVAGVGDTNVTTIVVTPAK
jgi:hypothetical protein